MQKWTTIGCHQVNEFLDRDEDFQALLTQRDRTEAAFLQIMATLPEQDRLAVERYIALCEEVEHCRTVTAYHCGRLFR